MSETNKETDFQVETTSTEPVLTYNEGQVVNNNTSLRIHENEAAGTNKQAQETQSSKLHSVSDTD